MPEKQTRILFFCRKLVCEKRSKLISHPFVNDGGILSSAYCNSLGFRGGRARISEHSHLKANFKCRRHHRNNAIQKRDFWPKTRLKRTIQPRPGFALAPPAVDNDRSLTTEILHLSDPLQSVLFPEHYTTSQRIYCLSFHKVLH